MILFKGSGEGIGGGCRARGRLKVLFCFMVLFDWVRLGIFRSGWRTVVFLFFV